MLTVSRKMAAFVTLLIKTLSVRKILTPRSRVAAA